LELKETGRAADLIAMGTRQGASLLHPQTPEIAVSEAASRTCGRLLARAGNRIRTHAYPDGGLICEDRVSRARPRMWRITADGELLPDTTYSFARQAFVRVPVPGEALAG
jgi:hypothetical protein